MTGNCPKCEAALTHVELDAIGAYMIGDSQTWKGVAYLCPLCRTILSVGIDPIALKADTVSAVGEMLQKVLTRTQAAFDQVEDAIVRLRKDLSK